MTYKFNLKYIFIFFAMIMALLSTGKAQANLEESSYIYIPAGAKCEGLISQDIDYDTAITGQPVEIILLNGFKYNNKVIASNDSVITGNITDKKTKNGKVLKIKIKFTSIRTPYNNIIPVNSAIELVNDNDSKTLLANEKINLSFTQPITVSAR